jgi:hypothetical protein
MFIEVYLRAKISGNNQDWNFVFNSDVLTLLVINRNLSFITLELTTNKTVLEFENQDDVNAVFEAFMSALTGENKELRPGLGFVRVVKKDIK